MTLRLVRGSISFFAYYAPSDTCTVYNPLHHCPCHLHPCLTPLPIHHCHYHHLTNSSHICHNNYKYEVSHLHQVFLSTMVTPKSISISITGKSAISHFAYYAPCDLADPSHCLTIVTWQLLKSSSSHGIVVLVMVVGAEPSRCSTIVFLQHNKNFVCITIIIRECEGEDVGRYEGDGEGVGVGPGLAEGDGMLVMGGGEGARNQGGRNPSHQPILNPHAYFATIMITISNIDIIITIVVIFCSNNYHHCIALMVFVCFHIFSRVFSFFQMFSCVGN